jgi:hypothetical protein
MTRTQVAGVAGVAGVVVAEEAEEEEENNTSYQPSCESKNFRVPGLYSLLGRHCTEDRDNKVRLCRRNYPDLRTIH